MYILSAYGPGRDTPLQLFGGLPREQSFEELRMRHYELTAQGRQQEAVQEAQNLVSNAEQQMKTALNDLDGAIRYICDGENVHPNRIDTCKARDQLPTALKTSSLSQPAFSQRPSAPAFGQPAVPPGFGQASSTPAFGQVSTTSTFGKPSAPAPGKASAPVSAFGQPVGSAFGKPSTPAFGQPSIPPSIVGQASTPAFGQPAALGRPPTTFGQPSSALGQPATRTLTFGQPSSQALGSREVTSQAPAPSETPSIQAPAFVQPPAPSHFANVSQTAFNIDEQPQNLSGASSQSAIFGQSADSQTIGSFADPFGLPTTTAATPSPSRIDAPTFNPFGVAAQPLTGAAYRGLSTTATSPFGRPSTQQQSNPLGQPSTPTPNMGAPAANAAATRRSSVQLPSGTAAQRDAEGKLRTWKGKEVRYISDVPHFRDSNHTEWQRIWFPDGPPTFTKSEDLPEAAYDAATKEKYQFAMEHGRFGGGGIPLMPPRKDWCNWNL